MAQGMLSRYAMKVRSHYNLLQYFRFGDVARSGLVPNHNTSVPDLSGQSRHGNWWNDTAAAMLSFSLVGSGQGYPNATGQHGEYSDNPTELAFYQAPSPAAVGSIPYYTLGYQPVVAGASRTYEIWCWRETVGGVLGMLWGQTAEPFTGQNGAYLFFGGQFGIGDRTVQFNPAGNDAAGCQWVDALPQATGFLCHCVVNFNDGAHTAELFINGESKGVRTGLGSALGYHVNRTLRFGLWAAASSYINYPWRGYLDEWAVYEPQLTANEIKEHWIVGSSRARGMFF